MVVTTTAGLGACYAATGSDSDQIVNPPPLFEPCPASRETAPSSCSHAGQVCTYPGDCGNATLSCDGSTWHEYFPSCNPPPPASCPLEAPPVGSVCAGAIVCSYESACGDYELTCPGANQTWLGSAPECECPAVVPDAGSVCTRSTPCLYGGCDEVAVIASCDGGVWTLTDADCPNGVGGGGAGGAAGGAGAGGDEANSGGGQGGG